MSIRRDILIPMVVLTVVCSVAILVTSIFLFSKGLSDAAYSRLDTAVMAAEHEIDVFKSSSYMAAVIMAEDQHLIDAVESRDRERIMTEARNLLMIAEVDFCTILDSEGTVLVRTHEPDNFGDSLAWQKNVTSALEGRIETVVERGTAVALSVRTGAPIYSAVYDGAAVHDGATADGGETDIIGVVTLGYRLDTPKFVQMLKNATGCEVTVFLGDERISTTVTDKDGNSVAGTKAEGIQERIIEQVLTGVPYVGKVEVYGADAIGANIPVYGADGEVAGIIAIGHYSDEDAARITSFVIMGFMVTLAVIALAVGIAARISKTIDVRINSLMDERNTIEDIALMEWEANQLKTRFLTNMSHEVRTPMNAILGIAEIALHNDNLPPETEEALGYIYESGNLLLGIINDILDLSKIEAGKLEIVPVKYDIPSLINDVAQLNILRYSNKPIDLTVIIDKNTPLNLFGDELRLKQILNNVLSNAFKYTDEGEVRLTVRSEASEYADHKYESVIIFEVSDTGQGMTPEELEKLFDEYTRFNTEANRSIVGTGLGMSITKRLVDLMGGGIFAESEPQKGSKFTVRIPQKRVNDLVCGSDIADKLRKLSFQRTEIINRVRIPREYMPYGSVLIVDDVAANIYVTRGMLLVYDLQIDTAGSGFEAIDKVRAGKEYDIIFMDHMMPEMDGVEATQTLRKMGYEGSVIALTANALVGQAEMFMENGFNGYISKPIDSRELDKVLIEFIRNKKPPEVVQAAREEQALRQSRREMRDLFESQRQKTQLSEVEQYFILDAEKAVDTLSKICGHDAAARPDEIDDKKLDSYRITVHGIKSALAGIGRTELSEFAYRLEQAALEYDFAAMAEETPKFIELLGALLEEMQEK